MRIKIMKRIKSKSRITSRTLPALTPTPNLALNHLHNLNLHRNLALLVPTHAAYSR